MKAFEFDPRIEDVRAGAVGAVIAQEISVEGTRLFHKGHTIIPDDLPALATVDRCIHAVRLDSNDIGENQAGIRLATAIAGDGVVRSDPRLSRVNLTAATKGLLRVDGQRLIAINRLPGVAVFSLEDRLPVLPGKIVTGAKITPLAIERSVLEDAERIAAFEPVIQVKSFKPLKVGVVSTEGLEGRARERFHETVRKKIGWFGGSVIGFAELSNDVSAVAEAVAGYVRDGAGLILTGGGNTIDPLDAALLALPRLDAEIVKFGVPVHPGSMFWLAYMGRVPIFNLASCSMYSRATSADLVLPWIMAGEHVTLDDLAALGFGGLLEGRGMNLRFPAYDKEEATEED